MNSLTKSLKTALLSASLLSAATAQAQTPVQLYRLREQARLLMESARVDSAVVLIRQVLNVDSTDGDLWRTYARALAGKNQHQDAIAAFQQALRYGVFAPSATERDVARQYALLGEPSNALDWLQRAAEHRLARMAQLKNDVGFASIRDSLRFRQLIGQSTQTLTRDQQWEQDIRFFEREAKRLHVHPDRPAYSREFQDSVNALIKRIAQSSDMSLTLGLQRLVVMLRDGHSNVGFQFDRLQSLPVDLYAFSDGYYVVNADGPAAKWIGHKVTAIGGRDIQDVANAAAAFISRDNPMTVLDRLPQMLVVYQVLQEIGAAADGRAVFTFRKPDGGSARDTLVAGPFKPARGPTHPAQLYDVKRLPEANAVHVLFNGVGDDAKETLRAFSARVSDTLAAAGARNLIVDVRWNGGGNTFLLPPLIRAITRFVAEDSTHRVFVLIGRHTFSAAQNFVSKLDWLIDPVFVGEPTGSAPNFTGEGSSTTLPNSGLNVGISNRVHMNSDWEDRRIWIAPDVPVALTAAQYFRGEDPVLQAVIDLLKVR